MKILKDLKLKPQKQGLCANIVIDGKVMERNLKEINKDEKWLLKELKVKGYSLENILLATVDVNEKLVIYERNQEISDINVLE